MIPPVRNWGATTGANSGASGAWTRPPGQTPPSPGGVETPVEEAVRRGTPWVERRLEQVVGEEFLANASESAKPLFRNQWLSQHVTPVVKRYQYLESLTQNPFAAATQGAAAGAAAMTFSELFYGGAVTPQSAQIGMLNPLEMGRQARARLLAGVPENLSSAERGLRATGNFFKKVIFNQNIKNLVAPLKRGNAPLTGLFALAYLSMIALGVDAAKTEYRNNRQQGHGAFVSGVKALWQGVKRSARWLASWEVANVGYAIGTLLFALAFKRFSLTAGLVYKTGAALAGVLSGVAFGVAGERYVLEPLMKAPKALTPPEAPAAIPGPALAIRPDSPFAALRDTRA
ncbi:MAG: hypothetical protein IPK79_12395 [Vampirovibrionales bacterium]|nr:hypothetical protein [Vampirovibrionales bacterium]